jgi:hypothetical protein
MPLRVWSLYLPQCCSQSWTHSGDKYGYAPLRDYVNNKCPVRLAKPWNISMGVMLRQLLIRQKHIHAAKQNQV